MDNLNFSNLTIDEIKDFFTSIQPDQYHKYLPFLESDTRTSAKQLAKKLRNYLQKINNENTLINNMMTFEKKLINKGFKRVAGVDEAGRGALAGPLVAAAVILPEGLAIEGLRDSKQLTAEKREKLFEIIIEKAQAYYIARIEHDFINNHGIQKANLKALHLAVLGLNPEPDYVLSDAFTLDMPNIPSLAIIKGDSLSVSIAAASILAKVTRDRIMTDYHQQYPEYRFDKHKGYSTLYHKELIKKYGNSPIHRTCFSPCSTFKQLTID